MDALDGRRRRLRHRDAGARGAREADHVDVRMRGERGTDAGPVAVHEVEHARRHARLVEDFGEDDGAAGRFLRRFQDDGIAGGERGRDLGGDLVERPVPGRDHRDDAKRLMHHLRAAQPFLERKIGERLCRGNEMAEPGGHLCCARKADRRAHFLAHRLGEVGHARLVFLDDPLEQRKPLGDAPLRPALESGPRGGDRLVDIDGGAKRDLATRQLGRGVDDVVPRSALALDPGAVDIVFQVAVHGRWLLIRRRCFRYRGMAARDASGTRRWQGERDGPGSRARLPSPIPISAVLGRQKRRSVSRCRSAHSGRRGRRYITGSHRNLW